MAKEEADGLKKIDLAWLKNRGILSGYRNETITWTDSWGNKSSVSINVSVSDASDRYLQFQYTQTDRGTDKKTPFEYSVPIITTPCRFGGIRYWFKCPIYTRGVYCGRRARVLYKGGDYFACRHCYNLAYSSQHHHYSGATKMLDRIFKMEELEGKLKRRFYKGKPTRKYRRYLRYASRLDSLDKIESALFK